MDLNQLNINLKEIIEELSDYSRTRFNDELTGEYIDYSPIFSKITSLKEGLEALNKLEEPIPNQTQFKKIRLNWEVDREQTFEDVLVPKDIPETYINQAISLTLCVNPNANAEDFINTLKEQGYEAKLYRESIEEFDFSQLDNYDIENTNEYQTWVKQNKTQEETDNSFTDELLPEFIEYYANSKKQEEKTDIIAEAAKITDQQESKTYK